MLKFYHEDWLPARTLVEEALDARFEVGLLAMATLTRTHDSHRG